MSTLRWTIILVLLGNSIAGHSQQLNPSVLSTSGAFYTSADASLSATVGEMTAVETYISFSAILTQGFQQPWDLGTSVSDGPIEGFAYRIFPNPSDGNVYLLTTSTADASFTIVVSDLLGRQLLQSDQEHYGKETVHPLDLSELSQGTYVLSLHIKDHHTGIARVFGNKITIIQ